MLVDGKPARISDVQVLDDVRIENRTVGKVIFMKNDMPVVVCGKGLLLIKEMSWDNEGANALPLKKFRARFQ